MSVLGVSAAQRILQHQWIIVEGNIGAGKSTFLRLAQRHLNVGVVLEPHEKWQQVGATGNLLDNFYLDPKRWAYTFQSYAFITRLIVQQQYTEQALSKTCFLERSVFSDRYCFAKNAYELGNMTDLEWHIYKEWFSWFMNHYAQKPTGFIYLRVDPTVCFKRMNMRNRNEESLVPLDYLKQLHEKHESWLVHKNNIETMLHDVPVLVLECNDEFEHDEKEQQNHMEKILNFFSDITYKHPIRTIPPTVSL